LLRLHVYESSGNEEYDKRALQTVERAAPFPSVSLKIRERVLNGDLILGFPL
jgi:outer membrane biosynthesis protein TonB